MGGVAGVVATHDNSDFRSRLDEGVGRVLILVCRVAEGIGRVGEVVGQRGFAVSVLQGIFEDLGDAVCLRCQHRGLVDHAHTAEVPLRIEPFRALVAEPAPEVLRTARSPDDVPEDCGFLRVQYHDRGGVPDAVREGRPGFFVRILPVNHHRMPCLAQLFAAVPHLLHERAGGVVGERVDSPCVQFLLDLHCGSECGNNDDVIRGQLLPRHQLLAGGREDEADAPIAKVAIHVGVVDHLTEQEDAPVRVGFHCAVGDLDGVFHPEAESEVARQQQPQGPEVQRGGGEVPLAGVLDLPGLLHPRDDRALVERRDVELSCHVKPGFEGCGECPLLARAAEASATLGIYIVYLHPVRLCDRYEDALGKPLAPRHLHRLLREVVDLYTYLVIGSLVILVNDTHAIRHHQTFAHGQAAACCEHEHVTGRYRHDHVDGDKPDLARGHRDCLAAEQVEANRA